VAIFSYRATSLDGQITEGVIEASDDRAAADLLKNSGVIPLKISAPKEGTRKRLMARSPKGNILTFTTELSALLNAGLPLDRSLNILSEISESREMKDIVKSVLKSIREGNSFSDALKKHPRYFSRLYVNMVRAGESGGVLGVVLEKLNEFLETTKDLKDHVISTMIYPAILFVTGVASIIVLMTYVLPSFSNIFSDLGASLPLSTQLIVSASNVIARFWWMVLLVLVALLIFFRSYVKSPAGRLRWDGVKLILVGEIIKKLETARFARTLGTLLKSGVPLLQALNNSKEIINNQVIAASINVVSKDVKEGKGMASPLTRVGVFPPLALSMIKVGEETGQLDTMLLQIATTYEKSLRSSIKRFVGLLQPAMVLFMGLVIGFIVLSMLTAIISVTDLPY
jgi:general secretion pathway protein F